MDDGSDGAFGITHLSGMPITLTFGVVLVAVLLTLILLRFLFGSITVKGGVK